MVNLDPFQASLVDPEWLGGAANGGVRRLIHLRCGNRLFDGDGIDG
jgi:hypothetical protein